MKRNQLIVMAALFIYAITDAQVNAGQVDDFQNGTTQEWTDGGSPSPPVNITSGGPDGSNDNYLQNTSLGGNGAGSRMVMFNEQQWAGNYINENIVAIKFDARVLTNNLSLRVAFDGAGGRICTTIPVNVNAGGNWAQVVIPISPSDFTKVAGGFNISQTLADVSDIRILSNTVPSWQGEPISATLEIDNIEAAMTLNISDFESVDAFEIIPNPGKDYIQIAVSQSNFNSIELNIYDVLGKQIHHQDLQSSDIRIPVSNWNSGIYFVQLASRNSNQIKRFIKL